MKQVVNPLLAGNQAIILPPGDDEIAKPHIVGTESHPFVEGRWLGPGGRCVGILGTRQGHVCGALRSESIHDGHRNWCVVCDGKIKAMTFLGTGVCSEIHRKQRDGEPLKKYAVVVLP